LSTVQDVKSTGGDVHAPPSVDVERAAEPQASGIIERRRVAARRTGRFEDIPQLYLKVGSDVYRPANSGETPPGFSQRFTGTFADGPAALL
jgi:hypothetical protein